MFTAAIGPDVMIVDCFTHTWECADQLGRCLPAPGMWKTSAAGMIDPNGAGAARHQVASEPVQATFVLGFKSLILDAEIPNDHIAAYVRRFPHRLVGFAGIDPSEPKTALGELRRARKELGMRGVAVSPAAAGFHPVSSSAMQVYAEAADCAMPILFHPDVFLCPAAKLEYARPVLLDEVARELPHARIVIAGLGHPWVEETLALLRKHPYVFAEISAVLQRPWQAYEALLAAYESGVMDKLLFGSGFPCGVASRCIETLYSLNHLVHGTSLPTIPRDLLRGIVERDALSLLNIGGEVRRSSLQAAGVAEETDD